MNKLTNLPRLSDLEILQYPLSIDSLLMVLLIPLCVICFIKYRFKMVSYVFTDFGVYFFIISIIGSINYLVSYSNDYFSNITFLQGLINLLLTYFLIRSVLYSVRNNPNQSETIITIFSYLILGSVLISEFFYYFYPKGTVEFFPIFTESLIDDALVSRHAGILKEPSYIACIGLAIMAILLAIKKEKVKISPFLAITACSIISKSFSSLVLILALTLILLFRRYKIYFDTKGSILVMLALMYSFFLAPEHTSSKMKYYLVRGYRMFIYKNDRSYQQRITHTSTSIRKNMSAKVMLLGAGLSQHHPFVDKKLKAKRIHVALINVFINIGGAILLITLGLFFHTRNIVGFTMFLLYSVTTGSFPSIPFSLLFVLSANPYRWAVLTKRIKESIPLYQIGYKKL